MKKLIAVAAFFYVVVLSQGQILQSTRFVKGSISDGEKILMAYLLPLEKSFNAIGSRGFDFQRSANGKSFVYSFGVQLAGAMAPVRDKTYNVAGLGLSEFVASDPSNTLAQTFAGNSNTIGLATRANIKVPSATFPFYTTKPLLKLQSPEGSGTALLGLGFLTASVYTNGKEAGIRIMPPIRVPGTDAIVYSAGGTLRAELNTLIKPMHSWPVIISVVTGLQYTRLSLDPGLAPEGSGAEISLQPENGPYDTQEFYISSRVIPFELMVQKEVRKLVIYAGAGMNFSKSHTALEGNIPLYKTDPTDTFSIIIEDFKDPVSYERLTASAYLNVGFKYFVRSYGLNAGYSISEYQGFYLGFGITL